jgi:perosamine synthetase
MTVSSNYKIPLYKPKITLLTKKYVNECLNSSWISSKGKFVNLFEKSFKNFTKINFCTSVCNGTAGLHLAVLALDIKKNDQVIVPTFTYVASVNCIKYVGATPVFVESDLNNFQINMDHLKKLISKKTKAVIIPHLYGNITDMELLKNLQNKFNFLIIEDCAEAVGSFFKKKHVGNFGDISVFSFFGNKTITTGEGGMVCSNNKNLIAKVIRLKGQGLHVTKKKKYYWHNVVGYNYRMTNINAAIGYSQMKIINQILKKKKLITDTYKKLLNDLPIKFIKTDKKCINSNWLVTILLKNKIIKKKIINLLEKEKIETRPCFYPVHSMPMYNTNKEFPNATLLSNNGLSLPSYPDLNLSQVLKICNLIKKIFKK